MFDQEITHTPTSLPPNGFLSEEILEARRDVSQSPVFSWHNASLSVSVNQSAPRALTIQEHLLASVMTALPALSLERVVNDCLSMYMQYIFPLGPIIHEPTIRAFAALDLSTLSALGENEYIDVIRSFTLTTALCAATALMLPVVLFPDGRAVSGAFLLASQQMLDLIQDHDIEHPDSSSVSIRMFQSNALHTVGKKTMSSHMLSQARVILQDIQVKYEQSFTQPTPLEGRLLQDISSLLYTSECSDSILNNRLGWVRENLGKTPILSEESVRLLASENPFNDSLFEHRLLLGFQLCQRLWSLTAEIIIEMRRVLRRASQTSSPVDYTTTGFAELMQLYLHFITILDDLPIWLQSPDMVHSADEDGSMYQKRCFWSQRSNILISFHCLKMILLNHCVEHGLTAMIGVGDQHLMIALKKTEIAQEVDSLQANGEPCVSSS